MAANFFRWLLTGVKDWFGFVVEPIPAVSAICGKDIVGEVVPASLAILAIAASTRTVAPERFSDQCRRAFSSQCLMAAWVC